MARALLCPVHGLFWRRAIRTGITFAILILALAGWAAMGLGGEAWAARSDSLLLLGIGLAGLVLSRRAGLIRRPDYPGSPSRFGPTGS